MYAILSHLWGSADEEDSFQTVQAAAMACKQRRVHAVKDSTRVGTQDSPVLDARDNLVRSLSAQAQRLFTTMNTLQQRESLTASEILDLQENWVRVSSRIHWRFLL